MSERKKTKKTKKNAANRDEIGLSITSYPCGARQRNACSNYTPLERTALRTRSETNKKN